MDFSPTLTYQPWIKFTTAINQINKFWEPTKQTKHIPRDSVLLYTAFSFSFSVRSSLPWVCSLTLSPPISPLALSLFRFFSFVKYIYKTKILLFPKRFIVYVQHDFVFVSIISRHSPNWSIWIMNIYYSVTAHASAKLLNGRPTYLVGFNICLRNSYKLSVSSMFTWILNLLKYFKLIMIH